MAAQGGIPWVFLPHMILPLLPTPGEPITAIFNSVSVDFLRLIRVVISTFCNRPVYLAIYLFIYPIYIQLYLCVCSCSAFTFSIFNFLFFRIYLYIRLRPFSITTNAKCWPRVTRALLGLLIAHLSVRYTCTALMITLYTLDIFVCIYIFLGGYIGHIDCM